MSNPHDIVDEKDMTENLDSELTDAKINPPNLITGSKERSFLCNELVNNLTLGLHLL